MGDLDIVNDLDEIIGKEDYIKVHSEGLRHRSVQIFVFYSEESKKLLVAERSRKQEVSAFKLHPPVGGHVRLGQNYLEAAMKQLKDELFYSQEKLPNDIILDEIAKYKNDSRETNKEHTCLFLMHFPGPFFPNPNETSRIFWQDLDGISEDMNNNPDKYTNTFMLAMRKYQSFIKKD